MEGARTSFDEFGARNHPIVRGEPGGAEKWKIELPGLDFAREMDNNGGRGWRGVQWRGLEHFLVWLVHAIV